MSCFFPYGRISFAGRLEDVNRWICNTTEETVFEFPDEGGTVEDYLKRNDLYLSSTYFFPFHIFLGSASVYAMKRFPPPLIIIEQIQTISYFRCNEPTSPVFYVLLQFSASCWSSHDSLVLYGLAVPTSCLLFTM